MTTTVQNPVEPVEPVVRDRADVRRQVKVLVVLGLAVVLLVILALKIDDHHVSYSFKPVTLDDPAKGLNGTAISWGAVVLTVVVLVAAALNRLPRGWAGALIYGAVGLSFYLAFLMWAFADQDPTRFTAAITNPIPGTIQIATPLVFGALAGCLCERAGVINIAIEGQFLVGAFFASVASSLFLSSYMGLLGGILAGVGLAALLAVFALRYRVNQIVLGVVLVAFSSGLTSFLLGQIPDDENIKQYFNEPLKLPTIEIPGLSSIPVVGQALFNQTILIYLMYASVVVVSFLLFETRWGLRVRSVGEHPKAADTVGIKVNRMRWQAVLLGGVFAGLGGAYYTVGSTGAFDRDVSAGTGFIALAAVIMGRWHPVGATAAAVFFGFMGNLQNQLGVIGKLPTELLGAAPYLATVIVVAGFVGRVRPPAADGEPYVKG
jgi:simple sugar transport system permease protein